MTELALAETGAPTLGSYPWASEDMRLAVACLSAEQRRSYIKLVRQRYRADRREYQRTVLAAELSTDPAGIADARAARAGAGAGGGHKRATKANRRSIDTTFRAWTGPPNGPREPHADQRDRARLCPAIVRSTGSPELRQRVRRLLEAEK